MPALSAYFKFTLVRFLNTTQMVSTNIADWDVIPDIIADGVSDQEEIMTAICETKGATFDGTDCVGELDDSTVFVSSNPYPSRQTVCGLIARCW